MTTKSEIIAKYIEIADALPTPEEVLDDVKGILIPDAEGNPVFCECPDEEYAKTKEACLAMARILMDPNTPVLISKANRRMRDE